jgi:Holliday junction resolvase RusA-like endonuclease
MTFTVMGKPIAKGRPKFARRGNFVSTYTPEKTVTYENLVKLMYMQAGGTMFEGEVAMKIEAFFELPKSAPKRVREIINIYPHTIKPDADNVAKSVADALCGYAYKDDSQITSLLVLKNYGDVAKVVVTIV